jgi:hypothetical protein
VFDGGDGKDLFEARLFCLDSTPEHLEGYIHRPGAAWTLAFRAARRLSLAEINGRDDVVRREDRRVDLRRELLRALFRQGQGWCETSARDFGATFAGDEWSSPLQEWLGRTDDALLRAYRERLFRAAFPGKAATECAGPAIDYVARGGERAPLRTAPGRTRSSGRARR